METLTPSHDLMAQKAAVGLIMTSPKALQYAIREKASPAWFSDPACAAVMDCCLSLARKEAFVDAQTVTSELLRIGAIEKIGGPVTVLTIEMDAGIPGSEAHWLEQVRDGWKRRESVRLLSRFQRDVIAGDCEPTSEAMRILSEIAAMERRVEARKPWRSHILDAIDDAEAVVNGTRQAGGVLTGIESFDRETGGIEPGMIVIAAETSGGKSLLMVQIAISMAKETGKPALIVSLEMSGKQIAQRCLAAEGNVPMSFLTRGHPTLSVPQYQSFAASANQLANLPILLEYCPGVTAGQVRAIALDAAQDTGLSCVVVDYVQLMGFDGRFDNREQAVSETARRLKVMQGELNCPVLVGSQLNDDKKLRESRAIGMHADEVYLIEHGFAESKIVFGKRRQGARDREVKVRMVGEFARFETA